MLKFRGILFTIATLGAISIALERNIVPVFILDDGLLDGVVSTQTDPLRVTSAEEFEAILGVVQERSYCLIFFIEDDFAWEYISTKDETGKTPFYHLRQAFMDTRVKILPRVIDPYSYFKDRFAPFDFNTFLVRQTTTKLKLEDKKYMYIFFEDGANKPLVEKLRRHDAIIQEVTLAARQICKGQVVAFYTGKRNPLEKEEEVAEKQSLHFRAQQENVVVQCDNANFDLGELQTEYNVKYQFSPVVNGWFEFSVQAKNSAGILLCPAEDPKSPNKCYQMVIGDSGNTKTFIGRKDLWNSRASFNTPKILNEMEFRGFFVKWEDGAFAVIQDGKMSPVVTWKDPGEPLNITRIGVFTSDGSTGKWKFETDEDIVHTPDQKEFHHFRPVMSGRINFDYRGPDTCYICLTNSSQEEVDPMYEIILGGWQNTKSAIKRNKLKVTVSTPNITQMVNFTKFELKWNNGHVTLRDLVEKKLIMEWTDPAPVPVTFVGVRAGYGAPAQWRVYHDTRC